MPVRDSTPSLSVSSSPYLSASLFPSRQGRATGGGSGEDREIAEVSLRGSLAEPTSYLFPFSSYTETLSVPLFPPSPSSTIRSSTSARSRPFRWSSSRFVFRVSLDLSSLLLFARPVLSSHISRFSSCGRDLPLLSSLLLLPLF